MPKMASAAAAAAQLAQMLGNKTEMSAQMPNYPVSQGVAPQSLPTRGRVLDGTNGIRSSGDPAADAFMQKAFTDYVYSWGKRYQQLKKDSPYLSDKEIEGAIGPRPSSVKDFKQISNFLGGLVVDPAEQEQRYKIETMREQFQLNKQMLGEQAAIEIAMQDSRQAHALQLQRERMSGESAEADKARQWTTGENKLNRDLERERFEQTKKLDDARLAMNQAASEANNKLISAQTAKIEADMAALQKEPESEAKAARMAFLTNKANFIANAAATMARQFAELESLKTPLVDQATRAKIDAIIANLQQSIANAITEFDKANPAPESQPDGGDSGKGRNAGGKDTSGQGGSNAGGTPPPKTTPPNAPPPMDKAYSRDYINKTFGGDYQKAATRLIDAAVRIYKTAETKQEISSAEAALKEHYSALEDKADVKYSTYDDGSAWDKAMTILQNAYAKAQ